MLQTLKKILSTDPEVEASIILGHKWTKIAHLAQKRTFLGNSNPLNFIYLLCPIILQHMDQNWTRIAHLDQKRDFLCLFIVAYYAAKSEENL